MPRDNPEAAIPGLRVALIFNFLDEFFVCVHESSSFIPLVLFKRRYNAAESGGNSS